MEMELEKQEKQLSSLWERLRWRVKRLIRVIRGESKPENSNMYKWAKSELDILLAGCKESEGEDGYEMQVLINKDILDIVKVFCSQGHSGSTAWYTLSMIKQLLDWKPITPINGEESEWGEGYRVDEYICQQNKRCSAVFRHNMDNSTAYYIDGRVYSDDGGFTWFTNRKSHIPVTFPFKVPEKPEYIYLNGEDSDEVITDPERIKELYEAKKKQFEES